MKKSEVKIVVSDMTGKEVKTLTNDTFEAGTHSDAIKMSYADFAQLAQAQLADFAEKLHSTNAAGIQSITAKEPS